MIIWAAYDRLTGEPLTELPGLQVTSSMSQIIGRGEQVTVKLPVMDRLPTDWELATKPLRAIIAGHIPGGAGEGIEASSVIWGGFVEKRTYSTGNTIDLTLQPPENWLARNYVGTAVYTNKPYTEIARLVGLDRLATQFRGTVYETQSTSLHSRTYSAAEDKTLLSVLQSLMTVEDGIEWATSWRLDADGRLGLVVDVAPMLGARANPDPAVLFSGVDWSITEDAGDGKGATIWTGVGAASGGARTTVTRRADDLINNGWLEIERRWQPDTGSTDPAIIGDYVGEAMREQREGTSTLSVSVHLDDCVPSRDFRLGDDIAIDLKHPDLLGVEGHRTARLLGWSADPDEVSGNIVQITPILTVGEA